MEPVVGATQTSIKLSHFTKALIQKLNSLKPKLKPDDSSRISVSQTVSFLAIAYEKIRNAVEYREGHLIRRAAIERILKRRLALNPEGEGEAENLIRELLWARYFPNEALGEHDVAAVQSILNKYPKIRNQLFVKKTDAEKAYFSQFLFDLLTCSIEEALSPQEASQNSTFTFFIYQVLKDKIKIEGISEEEKNAYFYVTLEKWFAKSDIPYLRYHLFALLHSSIFDVSEEKLSKLVEELPQILKRVDDLLKNPYSDRMRRFVKNQFPPFSILFEIFKKNKERTEAILIDNQSLRKEVEEICSLKYSQTRQRLNRLAFKAIVYIFLTKMLFALLLEYPLSLWIYSDVNYMALTVNTLFPPLLMFIIIGVTSVPGIDNTRRLYDRLEDIVDADKSYESTISFITKKTRTRRPLLIFFFTIFYAFTFFLTFDLLHQVLSFLGFNLVSEAVFFFFVSLVSFFAYRIRQVAKEYQVKENESFIRPFVDFFFLPVLAVGKFLSQGIAKLNFFTFIFDFLIEAPFKLLFDVIEEWIRFVRSKKEEII